MNKMQKTQGACGMLKATDQKMGAGKDSGKLETGKDLRQNKSGGSKAKGSM
jgi:hypothetical protein